MFARLGVALCWAGWALSAAATEPLTLPRAQRPEWLRRDGIVMAGSWEPLLFRVRRDGAPNYTPTPEQRAAYAREHSPEMIARLKQLGVNFVMLHCYKGAGLVAEKESMADAVRFAKLCHDAGLRVGVYTFSGTLMWELFYQETPQAQDWLLWDPQGKPLPYGKAGYRFYWDRNHRDAQAYLQRVVRFAVEDIHTDLVHFDNYVHGPGWDRNSQERFRRYLAEKFTAQERATMGAEPLDRAQPPTAASAPLLQYAWSDFRCASLADSYHDMIRYARTLRGDILMELNPGGVQPQLSGCVDHGRLLQGGEALWDEGRASGYAQGKLQSRIRTYKVARRMENSAFTYVLTPLEMAESMAFNLDCLGTLCWFEYDQIVNRPAAQEPVQSATAPFVQFYHQRHDLLRDAQVVADVALLRSFPTLAFLPPKQAALVGQVEQLLIDQRRAFQIIFDHQLDDLARYRLVLLPRCAALSDAQIAQLRRYVAAGGRICAVGPLATCDQWLRPRAKPALDDLPARQLIRLPDVGDFATALGKTLDGLAVLDVQAPPGLCVELTDQPQRRMVHLVNYRSNASAENVAVRVRVPAGRQVDAVTLASPEHSDDQALAFEVRNGQVRFVVPQVGVYEIAVVKWRQ